MATPNWLTAGDVVRIEMTGLGRMRTTVLNESADQ
jgi:2-keto-4-pentenoate hydratase/2-oxohepta-3-ene-1,7-dioic acid hydratase in catechol pathway